MNRHRYQWFLLALLLFAFLLRAWNLGGKSLWLDEAFAVWNAERTPAQIWNEVNDNHPPTYYLMLHYWQSLSLDESWVRLPSVMTSMLSLALTGALGRKLFGRKGAITAVSLLAVSPLSVWYAQEARMVVFVAPFALMIGFGLAHGGWRGGLLLALGLGGGLYFDYAIVPLWVIVSGIWLVGWWQNGRERRPFLLWLAGSTTGWVVFLPLLSHLGLVVGRLGNIFVIANIRERLGLPDLGSLLYLLALLGLGAATVVLTWLWRQVIRRPFLCQLFTIALISGFVLLTLLAPVPRLYSVKRLVVTGWPLVILLVAMVFGWLRPSYRWVRVGTVALSLGAVLVTLWFVPKDDWRAAVTYINQHSTAGDVVWIDPASGQNPYNYYQPKLPPMLGKILLENPPQAEIWHIAERQPGRPIPNGLIEGWLDENRPLLEVISFYRLEVRHYGPPAGID